MNQTPYRYGGARALVALHEQHLRDFLGVWKMARAEGLALPATDDPCYASLESLLSHVLRNAAGYLVWVCETGGLPKPVLPAFPGEAALLDQLEPFTEGLLAVWSRSLRELTEEAAYSTVGPSNWGPPYCLDAMLEHAVMHPARHAHQLRELLAGPASS